MKKLIFLLPLLFVSTAWAGPPETTVGGEYRTAPPTLTDKQRTMLQFDVNGNLKTTSSGGGAGSDVNIIEVGGIPVATTVPVNDAAAQVIQSDILTAVQGSIPAGSALIGKVGIDQTAGQNGVVVNSGTLTAAGNVTGADGSALTLLLKTFSLGAGYNGTTADLLRSGDVNNVAAATGYTDALLVGRYNATPPTLTDTRYGALQVGLRGALSVNIQVNDAQTSVSSASAFADGSSNTVGKLLVQSYPLVFNGSTWDRTFTCPSTAIVNVTAAATTELVALTASQIVRVCSFVVTESLAGSFKFVYGTGTNCGTGTTDITGSMVLATSANMALSASAGGSLFRTIAANALCLTAVTGNITGFVTYAKF